MAALPIPPFPRPPGPAVPQPPDLGVLVGRPALFSAVAPAGPAGPGSPMVEVRKADIFSFPCDAIVIPTELTMLENRYGPFPRKWRVYAGRNLDGYNRIVQWGGVPLAPLIAPPPVGDAVKSPS
jgi:hypothetical protein